MKYLALLLVATLFIPGAAYASTVRVDRSLVLSEQVPGNAYLVGTDVNVVTPLPADVLATGATLSVSAPVAGDAMLAGGSVRIWQPVAGDVRLAGGRVTIEAPIGGDILAAGGTVEVSGTASSTRIAGGTVRMIGGSKGPVVIYGADVYLAGDFAGDVTVVASDSITIAEGAHVRGIFKYNAPQQVEVPASALMDGGVVYTGQSSYLPTTEEARNFAIAGATVFFIVQLISVIVAAGLIAGLLPKLTNAMTDRVLTGSLRRFILSALLGFAVAVAAPVFILLLAISFVGMAVALLLALLYFLVLCLGYIYAGIIVGAWLARLTFKQSIVSWRFAVLGMAVLYIVSIIPFVGPLIVIVLSAVGMGALLAIGYRSAFGRENEDPDLAF